MGCLAFKGSRSTDQIKFDVDYDQFKNVFLEKHGMGFIDTGNSSQLHAQHGQNSSLAPGHPHVNICIFLN